MRSFGIEPRGEDTPYESILEDDELRCRIEQANEPELFGPGGVRDLEVLKRVANGEFLSKDSFEKITTNTHHFIVSLINCYPKHKN